MSWCSHPFKKRKTNGCTKERHARGQLFMILTGSPGSMRSSVTWLILVEWPFISSYYIPWAPKTMKNYRFGPPKNPVISHQNKTSKNGMVWGAHGCFCMHHFNWKWLWKNPPNSKVVSPAVPCSMQLGEQPDFVPSSVVHCWSNVSKGTAHAQSYKIQAAEKNEGKFSTTYNNKKRKKKSISIG